MLSKLFVITIVLIFGLSMFAAGLLAPEDYRASAQTRLQDITEKFFQTAEHHEGTSEQDGNLED